MTTRQLSKNAIGDDSIDSQQPAAIGAILAKNKKKPPKTTF
jgi:hypothetical protein